MKKIKEKNNEAMIKDLKAIENACNCFEIDWGLSLKVIIDRRREKMRKKGGWVCWEGEDINVSNYLMLINKENDQAN